MTYLLMFLYGVIADTLWVVCTHCVQNRSKGLNRHTAVVSGLLLAGLAGGAVGEIADDRWVLVPELIGMLVGMYVGMAVADRLERAP